MLTNGKTIIAAGIPTESVWAINQGVKLAGSELGIELKGAWGAHLTVNRFLEAQTKEELTPLLELINKAPTLGLTTPTAIDVGYFHTDPSNGFVFTTHERFDLATARPL